MEATTPPGCSGERLQRLGQVCVGLEVTGVCRGRVKAFLLLSAAPNRHGKPVTAAPLPAEGFLTSAEPQLPQQLARNSFSIGDPKATSLQHSRREASREPPAPLHAVGCSPATSQNPLQPCREEAVHSSGPGSMAWGFFDHLKLPRRAALPPSAPGAEQTPAVTLTLKPPQKPSVSPAGHRSCSSQTLTLNPSSPEPAALPGS